MRDELGLESIGGDEDDKLAAGKKLGAYITWVGDEEGALGAFMRGLDTISSTKLGFVRGHISIVAPILRGHVVGPYNVGERVILAYINGIGYFHSTADSTWGPVQSLPNVYNTMKPLNAHIVFNILNISDVQLASIVGAGIRLRAPTTDGNIDQYTMTVNELIHDNDGVMNALATWIPGPHN